MGYRYRIASIVVPTAPDKREHRASRITANANCVVFKRAQVNDLLAQQLHLRLLLILAVATLVACPGNHPYKPGPCAWSGYGKTGQFRSLLPNFSSWVSASRSPAAILRSIAAGEKSLAPEWNSGVFIVNTRNESIFLWRFRSL